MLLAPIELLIVYTCKYLFSDPLELLLSFLSSISLEHLLKEDNLYPSSHVLQTLSFWVLQFDTFLKHLPFDNTSLSSHSVH